MCKQIGMLSACAHRLYLYRPELFNALRNEGYEVTVFGPEPQQQGDEWLGKEGITYIQLPLSRRGIDPISEMKARSLIAKTAKKNTKAEKQLWNNHIRLLLIIRLQENVGIRKIKWQ